MTEAASSTQDDGLLARAQAGEAAALARLLERERTSVVRFALRVCVSPEDAQDAAQETLLSLARYVGAFRGAARLSTWLFTVTRNHCLRLARRSLRSAAGLEAAHEVPSDEGSPEDLLAHEQLRLRVSQVMATLEPSHREVLLQRDVLGEPAPAAARTLGLGVAALKSRLHRARAELRERLLSSFTE
jgi:RNA polymerase sigma-70 factor (ECF subfamily)